MNLKLLAGVVFATSAVFIASADYIKINGQLKNSTIYPSTSHSYILTVPEAYNPDSTAILYVGLDGILCNAPEVFDRLYSEGKLPAPVLGVFLQPGVVVENETVLRYNRSNEFDATDGRFTDFLETELFPEIEKLQTADGRAISLPKDPNLRMIFGLSSGGIAAFSAAWNRPDMFGRVFSGCGTFVTMRGGEQFQLLARKTEPKPLRIYLQDGFSDAWNPLFGSWFEANAMLGTALEFAGYDCKFDWQEGVHSVRRATEIFPEVVEWMWRDYPAPLTKGTTQNNFLNPLLENSGDWEVSKPKTAVEVQSIEIDGTCHDVFAVYPDSSIIATTAPQTNFLNQYLVDANGQAYSGQRFYYLHSPDNSILNIAAMEFDSNGNLWVLTNAGLQICDQNGRVRGILSLPVKFDTEGCQMKLFDGRVEIYSPLKSLSRKVNVGKAVPGVKPKSQGAA